MYIGMHWEWRYKTLSEFLTKLCNKKEGVWVILGVFVNKPRAIITGGQRLLINRELRLSTANTTLAAEETAAEIFSSSGSEC